MHLHIPGKGQRDRYKQFKYTNLAFLPFVLKSSIYFV